MTTTLRLCGAALLAGVTLVTAPTLRAQVASQEALAAQQVLQLAPQLVPFAGSAANFQNLVNGLGLGVPVTLTAVGADGVIRTTTFTTPGGLTPLEIARTLEAARQQLITQGIGTPTAEQIGVTLVGGPLLTPLGTTAITGLFPGTGSLGVQTTLGGAGVLPGASAGATVPGVTVVDANPANVRPTAPSLNTSASPFFGTSDSPVLGTSDSQVLGTSNTPVRTNLTTLPAPGAATLVPAPPIAVPASPVLVPGTRPGIVPGAATVVPGAVALPAGATTIAPNGLPSPAAQIQGRR